jgi:hypothetical protein
VGGGTMGVRPPDWPAAGRPLPGSASYESLKERSMLVFVAFLFFSEILCQRGSQTSALAGPSTGLFISSYP